MPWSWSNVDWNGTGAMVQAVGSVVAIFAAILIDGRAAARLRLHQRQLDDAAAESRVVAILNAASTLRTAADDLEESVNEQSAGARLSEPAAEGLDACLGVLDYHLRQTVELNPGTLEGLVLAHRIFSVTVGQAAGNHPKRNVPGIVGRLRSTAKHLDALAADLAQETDRI